MNSTERLINAGKWSMPATVGANPTWAPVHLLCWCFCIKRIISSFHHARASIMILPQVHVPNSYHTLFTICYSEFTFPLNFTFANPPWRVSDGFALLSSATCKCTLPYSVSKIISHFVYSLLLSSWFLLWGSHSLIPFVCVSERWICVVIISLAYPFLIAFSQPLEGQQVVI